MRGVTSHLPDEVVSLGPVDDDGPAHVVHQRILHELDGRLNTGNTSSYWLGFAFILLPGSVFE